MEPKEAASCRWQRKEFERASTYCVKLLTFPASSSALIVHSADTRDVKTRDVLIIGIGQSAVLLIIGISRLVRWYQPIVIYTVGRYKFLFLLPKVNKHE